MQAPHAPCVAPRRRVLTKLTYGRWWVALSPRPALPPHFLQPLHPNPRLGFTVLCPLLPLTCGPSFSLETLGRRSLTRGCLRLPHHVDGLILFCGQADGVSQSTQVHSPVCRCARAGCAAWTTCCDEEAVPSHRQTRGPRSRTPWQVRQHPHPLRTLSADVVAASTGPNHHKHGPHDSCLGSAGRVELCFPLSVYSKRSARLTTQTRSKGFNQQPPHAPLPLFLSLTVTLLHRTELIRAERSQATASAASQHCSAEASTSQPSASASLSVDPLHWAVAAVAQWARPDAAESDARFSLLDRVARAAATAAPVQVASPHGVTVRERERETFSFSLCPRQQRPATCTFSCQWIINPHPRVLLLCCFS